jgi:GMP synthase (glutamine-hydrolysing)
VVLDFGGQYSHLITRRIRELHVFSELLPHTTTAEQIKETEPKGIILSGGPASVYNEEAPSIDPEILKLGIPILGICYGLQLIVQRLGGKVEKSKRREYGKTFLKIDDTSDLFKGIESETQVWMSHADRAERIPPGFEVIAHSENCPIAALRDRERRLFAVQFHPEVGHTKRGIDMLRNFVFEICGCKAEWTPESIVESSVRDIRSMVGEERVLCAISGGIDSTCTALIIHKAIHDKLVCIFVDHGLLRENEANEVLEFLSDFGLNLRYIDASSRFLEKLRGVTDAEEKRKMIGEEFIKVFVEEGRKLGSFGWLAQGTLYPDVIESARTGSPASKIKSHHNVAGLPGWMKFKLLEPLRLLYKDEVRLLARELGVPSKILERHPFPGPGLAVRIIGEVTSEKLAICRKASKIVEDELRIAGLYNQVWQAFAIVGDDKAVGVFGDERRLGYIVTIRIVESLDGMTADWARLPYPVLERISSRITNEVPGVTLVTYAVSSKPPSTIEPC